MVKTKLRSTRRKAPARTARPRSKPHKTVIRRASRERIASLTLMQINRALVDCGGTKTYAAHRLGISPRTLTRLRRELLEQQAAEQNTTVPPPDEPAPPDLGPDSDEKPDAD